MANLEKIEDRPTWNSMRTPKIMERMESLYESSKWHDCVFKLWHSDGGAEELVFAHSLVLASSSPVFEALCFGPMAEESPISVPDVDPVAFRMMIKFIYTDNIEFMSVESACNVLYASKKYLIYTLAGLAISYISYHINESNCLQVHEFASYVHEERLVKESWAYLRAHLDDVLKYFSYEAVSKEFITALVGEDSLNGGELVVFKICNLWAEAECQNQNMELTGENIRKVLMEAHILNKIRWLTFSLDEFEDGPKLTGILTHEEIDFISEAICTLGEIKKSCLEASNNNNNDEKIVPPEAKMAKPSLSLCDDALSIAHKRIIDSNVFTLSVCSAVAARRKIPLKRVYCHRYIERESRPMGLQAGLKVCTVVSTNKSVRLNGIFLNAKILPIPQLNTVYTHTCVIERDYKEKIIINVVDSLEKTLFTSFFSETVKYGTVFKIPLQPPVNLERLNEYKIIIDLVNSVENYPFGVRNSVSKFPSGLSVSFKELAALGGRGKFVEANDLSVVSGLELSL